MKFVSIIKKLLGMPKMLKNKHWIEMDITSGDEAICIKHESFNQNDTVMFLQMFYRELESLRKYKEKEWNEDLQKRIPALSVLFTVEGRNYLLQKDTNLLVESIHLINLRLVNSKKTIEMNNIEKNVNSLGSTTIKNAIKRFKNKNK